MSKYITPVTHVSNSHYHCVISLKKLNDWNLISSSSRVTTSTNPLRKLFDRKKNWNFSMKDEVTKRIHLY